MSNYNTQHVLVFAYRDIKKNNTHTPAKVQCTINRCECELGIAVKHLTELYVLAHVCVGVRLPRAAQNLKHTRARVHNFSIQVQLIETGPS